MTLRQRIEQEQARRACYRHNHEGQAVVLDCTVHGPSVPLATPEWLRRREAGQLPAKDLTPYVERDA